MKQSKIMERKKIIYCDSKEILEEIENLNKELGKKIVIIKNFEL